MAKEVPFFFGASGEVEDGNGDDKRISSQIPLADDDEEVFTDDDVDNDEAIRSIPVADEPKSKKKLTPKKEEVKEEEEEDEDDEEEEEETEEDTEEDEDDEELSTINVLATDFIQKGLLVPKEGVEYDDSETGLARMMEDTIEARLMENIPDEYKSVLDAIKQGIPASEWINQVTPDEDLRNADLDDEENQEILVARASKLLGLTDAQITKKINRLKAAEMLRDEAEESQITLIKKDEEEKAANNKKISDNREAALQQQRDFILKLHKDAENLKEVQGVYINKKTAKELVEYATKPVNTKGETQYMIDRNDPELLLQAAFLVKNAKSNILQKVASSKATKSLKDKLESRSDSISSSKGRTPREATRSGRMGNDLPWSTRVEVED